jgi:hypothetical protein
MKYVFDASTTPPSEPIIDAGNKLVQILFDAFVESRARCRGGESQCFGTKPQVIILDKEIPSLVRTSRPARGQGLIRFECHPQRLVDHQSYTPHHT